MDQNLSSKIFANEVLLGVLKKNITAKLSRSSVQRAAL
jgi:hypothetical protein